MDRRADKAMLRVRELFEKSGLTLDELGQKMGHTGDMARKSAWQFLNKVADPRLSTLRKFAEAVGVSIVELFPDEKKNGRSK
jgi:transcriptional regulator with XRE-family HTH domain